MNDDVKNGNPAKVVFFQHGLISAADDWISNEASVAPAFEMARAGYDVWLGNNRGNFNSPDNINFSQKSIPKEYFDYSFQKLGEYDLPT